MKPDSGTAHLTGVFSNPFSGRSDGELLKAWKVGEQSAADVLWQRYTQRLIGLVASRVADRFRDRIAPEEVVQSAWGSFFNAVKRSRVQVDETLALWNLLATFAKRKLARRLERSAASKRGGHVGRRIPFDPSESAVHDGSGRETELLDWFETELEGDLHVVLMHLLQGRSQLEIARELGVNERTVRRRIKSIRERLGEQPTAEKPRSESPRPSHLPQVGYGEFVLGKMVGSGGFGKVYRARMQRDAQTVAVKFLRRMFWKVASMKDAFLQEIDHASKLEHPGILRYRGWGLSPHGAPYLVSDWINGKRLDQQPRPDEATVRDQLVQLCEAVRVIHEVGLIHGDLTPGNVLVRDDRSLVITDFGMATETLTKVTSRLGGTFGFAAPEQLLPDFGTVGPWTDLYALGGIAYWLVHGQPPHHGSVPAEAIARTFSSTSRGAIQDASRFGPFIIACLRPEPSERCLDFESLLRLLRT
ncbi:MAG: protein kinase [Planctomycetota bacterium]